MAYWFPDAALATSPNTGAYHWNVGLPNVHDALIPMPKAAGGSREGRVLRQTFEKVEGFRQVTTPEFRANCFRGKATSIGFLPHPSVLSDDMGAKAWMQKFSKAQERNIAHVPEQAVVFVDGMPLLVSFQDSHM